MRARGEIKKLGPWVYFISLAVENWYNKAVFINVLFSGMIHDLPDCRGFSKVGPRDRLDLLQGLPREKTTTTTQTQQKYIKQKYFCTTVI